MGKRGEDDNLSANEALIKVENVKKSFKIGTNSVEVLRGISLEIYQGEFVAIVGESGSGKTTLLNIIGGLLRPSEGSVVIASKDITAMSENQLAIFRRENIGFVFQSYNLIPHFTAVENVEIPLMFKGISKKKRREMAAFMLEKVGLKDRLFHKPAELSGGQQQRVAIARALVTSPKIILADEPTGNLDSKNGQEILDLMLQLNKNENITLVVVTHSQVVSKTASRVIKIADGLIIGT
ncbi:putative ABC transport system ATP-binding protein [Caldicellulosiruptor bescii]|uniref:ABC transporter related n=2 Tax=Caldicellulosiruptor bescii TaxID=31899 RepID=B9MLR1_CALBD|nr:ABC transporter ATP-binding protein [Caldicellulosiruptor bescii]ACM59269.1 ABC transporter related [Caldicellulosiruptor bescii DSM 6725]PBC88274.1 putative ABC transport system ATP-binding protein [Caldicellulosiruptor bescii]PBC92245.1 putative ABC transport system ATP-binding protein [Caldicellulosiruptor bescii]PBD04946.1 putative ABC transport system ATP-binding protein [Caldicellulosiruptor bescii]PBD05424.1 putative ABC transport system ATP-binding protein [Caldicellulosiruptor besc